MKPQEKAKELLCANCSWRVVCEEEKETCRDYDKLIEMHKWSKEQFINWARRYIFDGWHGDKVTLRMIEYFIKDAEEQL